VTDPCNSSDVRKAKVTAWPRRSSCVGDQQ